MGILRLSYAWSAMIYSYSFARVNSCRSAEKNPKLVRYGVKIDTQLDSREVKLRGFAALFPILGRGGVDGGRGTGGALLPSLSPFPYRSVTVQGFARARNSAAGIS